MDLLEEACVRITIKNNGVVQKQGTGVVISNRNRYYVLTAMHCFGDLMPDICNIFIENQRGYTSEFENITIVSIISYSIEEDWALIEIEYDDKESSLNTIKLGYGFIKQETAIFYGYQGISNNQFRPFTTTILVISNDKKKFQINLSTDTFNQAGENGQYIAQGLSGSGVYIIKNKSAYLIGILNSVKSEKAWNDDINCCSVITLSDFIGEIENLSDFDFLKRWEQNLENEKTIEDIRNYKSLNNDDFENLQRKNRIIYETNDIADKRTQKDLLKYLSLQENIDNLDSKYPELYKDFVRIVRKFQDTVEYDYSKTVNNNNEAKDTKVQLRDALKYELEQVVPNDFKIDLADFQIIEWLLNCSLNFKNN